VVCYRLYQGSENVAQQFILYGPITVHIQIIERGPAQCQRIVGFKMFFIIDLKTQKGLGDTNVIKF
jgi:hypothetical protein